jgi:dienelactone hydrolase
MRIFSMKTIVTYLVLVGVLALSAQELPSPLAAACIPPANRVGDLGGLRSPMLFADGSSVDSADEWQRRRAEIRAEWISLAGPWPTVMEAAKIKRGETTERDGFVQTKIEFWPSAQQKIDGYLLEPEGPGPFPAVVVPYYEPETSVGLKGELRDFAKQLTKRGMVTLAIGSPGGDARLPDCAGQSCQPLVYLGWLASRGYEALAQQTNVDSARIGIVGHSYGGKWAMFGACLDDRFACGAWSDPGVAFDDARNSVNYWEPWYLGLETGKKRKTGLITAANPAHGAYAQLRAKGHDLHEIQCLMAPRPFLVSGGSEDGEGRWASLNHALNVSTLLGHHHRVALSLRPAHPPTEASNDLIYTFFEHWLGRSKLGQKPSKAGKSCLPAPMHRQTLKRSGE